MAHRLLRDLEVDGWERSDFPIICESCLGNNPYVRMERNRGRGWGYIYSHDCSVTKARCRRGHVMDCSCHRYFFLLKFQKYRQEQNTIRMARSVQGPLRFSGGDQVVMQDIRKLRFVRHAARAGLYESSYGKLRPNDTILKLQRTTPYYKRNRAHVCSFYIRGECTRGAECPHRHEMPVTGELSQQNIKDRYYGVNDPVALKLLKKAGEMPSLEASEDESIKTL
ncbi:hypothetical protein Ancab_029892 [Ancistrocladus abbreviatus]